MVERQQHAPQGIYALADHIDTVLAAVEDLLKLHRESADPSARLRLELVAITHVLQARQRMRELDFPDLGLARRSMLFLAGTDAFETAKSDHGHPAADTPLNEGYMIGRRIPIKVLTDLASAMLDGLESSYVLYQHDEQHAALPSISAPVSEVWSSTTQ
jgi:hypothetical protein